MLTDRATVD